VWDNSLADLRYATGRHTAPIFSGDTVFAATEIRGTRAFDGRPDVGVLETTLRGYKYVAKDGEAERVQIFELEREIVVKRRSHYA
jgi:acyl dehydratase